MNPTKELKLGIIEMLVKANDLYTLNKVHHQLEEAVLSIDRKKPHRFWKAVTSIRKNVSLQEIMNEQSYKPISYQEFRAKSNELVWEESLEVVLDISIQPPQKKSSTPWTVTHRPELLVCVPQTRELD